MSSYRFEERGKSHPNGHFNRYREDVRLLNKDEEPRVGREGRGDTFRRSGRGSNFNFNHTTNYEPEVERHIHVTRRKENLIVRIPNDHYQMDLNGKPNVNRRGQGNNNSNINNGNNGTISGIRPNQGPLRSSMRNSNNDGQNQPRTRYETSERHRNRSFREYSDNGPDWKPDGSGYSGGSRGMFNSAFVSADWNRNLGARRSGRYNDGADGGSRGMRRRGGGGGGGDNGFISYRVSENDYQNDRDNRMGDRSHHGGRGSFNRRGSIRGSRIGGGRGGRGGGFSSRAHDNDQSSYKPEVDDHTSELDKQDGVVNPEDSNSTDDDQYHLNVDLKTDDNLQSEMPDSGLNIKSEPLATEPEISKMELNDRVTLEVSDERSKLEEKVKIPKNVHFEDEEKRELPDTEGTSAPEIIKITEESKQSEENQGSESSDPPIESEEEQCLEVPEESEEFKEEIEQNPIPVDPSQSEKPDVGETEQKFTPVDSIQPSTPDDNTNHESDARDTPFVSAITDESQNLSVPSESCELIKPTSGAAEISTQSDHASAKKSEENVFSE
nr:expressed protein [Hymenolepis microstoma]